MYQQFVLAANKSLVDAAGQSSIDALPSMAGAQFLTGFLEELILFTVTIIFAVMLRGGFLGSKAKVPCCASKSQRPSPRSPKMTSAEAAQGPHVQRHTCGMATTAANDSAAFQCLERAATDAAGTRALSNPEEELLQQRIAEVVRCAGANRPPDEALEVYAAMRAARQHLRVKESAKLAGHSPLEFYGALIRCAGRMEQPDLLEQILDDMASAGVARPRGVHESVMKLLAGKGYYRQALAIYDRMKADGIEPTPVTLSCLSNFAAELGELDLSLKFFDRLSALGMPSIRAFMTVLRVHATRKDWPRSRKMFDDMQRQGVAIDSLALNIILSTGIAAGELQAARGLLEEAQHVLHPPVADVVSYNTVMKGYAQNGDGEHALSLLNAMLEQSVKPNSITFNTAIDAAVRSAKSEDAWRLLSQMRGAGISPDKFTCSILMKSLSSSATAEQISAVLELTRTVRGDAVLLGNLFRGVLEAAAKLRDTPLLMRIFAQMRTQHVYLGGGDGGAPDRRLRGRPGRPFRAGAMLRFPLAACVQAGKLEDAVNLLGEALEFGLSPPSEALDPLMEAIFRRQDDSPLCRRLQTLASKHGLSLPGNGR